MKIQEKNLKGLTDDQLVKFLNFCEDKLVESTLINNQDLSRSYLQKILTIKKVAKQRGIK